MKAFEVIGNIMHRISGKTKMSKKLIVILALFFVGLAALLVSELSAKEPVQSEQTETSTVQLCGDEYARSLEERLVSIISAIDGAGKVQVMVTLESGSEEVYLYNSDYGGKEENGKNSYEQKKEYIIVGDSEEEKGIVVRTVEPKIRGVAVVCEGAGNETVKNRIVQTVTALLDISSANVSVVGMK